MSKRYTFIAKVESTPGGACVLFPYDVEQEFGTKGRVPVKAKFNGVPYSGSLVKYGNPQHMLPVLKGIREQIGLEAGDMVEVELWRDEKPRTVEVPEEFRTAMQKAKVLEFFESLSYTHQREYCRYVSEAKKEETRVRRSEKAIEMLRSKVKTPDNVRETATPAKMK